MELEQGVAASRWFRLAGEIRVEIVDKFSGGNVHPDRVMNQWVLVLMTSGERTFRIYGEDHAVHGGEFFLLPPHVRHSGIRFDQHEAYFAHFQGEGAPIPPPRSWTPGTSCCPCGGGSPWSSPAST